MYRSTFLKGLAIFTATLAFTACDTGSPVDTGSHDLLKGSTPPPNANPAIVFRANTVVRNSSYPGLHVMDADGTDKTEIYRGQLASIFRKPTWAPTGTGTAASPWSVSFTEQISGATYLKRVNVWVLNGEVYSSTPTTLVSFSSTSGKAVQLQASSPSTTTSEIAYVEVSTDLSAQYSKLFVIPASGGTATELHSSTTNLGIGTLAWNSDGSKLAYRSSSTNEGMHIRILDRTSPSTAHRVILANEHSSIGYIDWSRTGSNKIAYDVGGYLYTTNVSDVTPTPSQVTSNSQQAAGSDPTWSSDNTMLAYGNSGSGVKAITLSSGATATLVTSGSMPEWRR